jgi:hypothetical protein
LDVVVAPHTYRSSFGQAYCTIQATGVLYLMGGYGNNNVGKNSTNKFYDQHQIETKKLYENVAVVLFL